MNFKILIVTTMGNIIFQFGSVPSEHQLSFVDIFRFSYPTPHYETLSCRLIYFLKASCCFPNNRFNKFVPPVQLCFQCLFCGFIEVFFNPNLKDSKLSIKRQAQHHHYHSQFKCCSKLLQAFICKSIQTARLLSLMAVGTNTRSSEDVLLLYKPTSAPRSSLPHSSHRFSPVTLANLSPAFRTEGCSTGQKSHIYSSESAEGSVPAAAPAGVSRQDRDKGLNVRPLGRRRHVEHNQRCLSCQGAWLRP